MAPRSKGDEYIKIGIETDDQSFQQYESRLNAVIQKGQALQQSIARAYVEGNGAAQKAKATFDSATTALDKQSKSVKQLKQDYKEAGDEAERAQRKGAGFNLGGVERRTSQVGGALRGLGASDLGNAVSGVGDVLQLVESLGELPEAAGLANVAMQLTTAQLGLMGVGFVAVAALVGAVAIAQQKYNDELKAGEAAIEQAISDKQKYYTAVYTMDSEQAKQAIENAMVQKRIANDVAGDIQAEINRQSAELAKTNAAFSIMSPENKEANLRARDEFKKLFEELDVANTSFDDAGRYINLLTIALDKNAFAVNDARVALEKEAEIYKAIHERNRVLAEERRQAEQKRMDEQQKQDEQAVSILKKRDSDIETIQTKRSESEIALQQRTADTVEKIIQSTLVANEAAFRKLQDQQSKLLLDDSRADQSDARKAAFDDLQMQIEDNRTERDELKAHLKKVKEIRQGDRAAERDAEYDRNFDALFRLQERKTEQEDIENATFADQKEARLQSQKDQREDTTRQRQFERNERRIALQNALMDARNAYVRELELQQQAEQMQIAKAYESARIELDLLNSKTNAEITMRQQGAINEINLISQTEQVKQLIFLKYLNEYRTMLGQAPAVYQNPNVEGTAGGQIYQTSRSTGVTIKRFAQGGFAQAGFPFEYNDGRPGQRESFGGVMLPAGRGIAYPFQSGQVNPGASGGNTYNFYNTFTGNNPQQIADAVDKRVAMRLKQVQR
jgi:hypothetical protein